ncbi:MAG: peroxiredoxin family protein [Deltaproteobacteria bacterium]|nr:peroxiredoxin family protein [Deltaproteobacteria bacterium]
MAVVLGAAGCGDMAGDLLPSGADKRGGDGPYPGHPAPDFTVTDSLNNPVTLSAQLTPATPGSGVVLYFTMWCPVCNGHADQILSSFTAAYPNVRFYLVDFVSSTVAQVRGNQLAYGYGALTTLADTARQVFNKYEGTMAIAVVVDRNGIIQMNEGFKDGARLTGVLNSLP